VDEVVKCEEDVSSNKCMDSGRIEKLQKFRGADEDSVPAVVCNDLAGRGLDLVCYHVINCDFPLNPVSYISTCCFSISSSTRIQLSEFFFVIYILFQLQNILNPMLILRGRVTDRSLASNREDSLHGSRR
jgi:hypothetical protein